MRRWNGWGDSAQDYPLPDAARAFLAGRVGPAQPPRDATLEEALRGVPASRLPAGAPFDAGAELRLRHARGQSFPDWVAMRAGRLGPYPDGVAQPATHEDCAAALDAARKIGAIVIPYGGGTSVVGHLTVPAGDRPVVSLSLERMQKLLDFDETSWLARFQAGTAGPELERQLNELGYRLGHFPQSYEYSTLGGWVVTRSSGQQSLKYGRMEQLFAGGRMATPRGELAVGGVPASSAGPDLRECVLGSEGRLGVLTEVTVRVRPLPVTELFHAVFFDGWEAGAAAARALAQSDAPLSMLRLSNPQETVTQLELAGHPRLIAWLRRYLRMRGVGAEPSMMVFAASGPASETARAKREALALARRCGGVPAGHAIGNAWAKNRFRGPYLRNSLWQAGYGVDTVETAVNWPQATALMNAMEQAARDAFAQAGQGVHAFTHLSHVYRQGCSIYSTFVFRAAATPEENLERWARMKKAVSEAIVAHGGTISHQHGVGADHAPYLPASIGALGMDLIRAMARELDPDGMMNPGKLFT